MAHSTVLSIVRTATTKAQPAAQPSPDWLTFLWSSFITGLQAYGSAMNCAAPQPADEPTCNHSVAKVPGSVVTLRPATAATPAKVAWRHA